MKNLFAEIQQKVKPEYFFWVAVVLALFLSVQGSLPSSISTETLASTASSSPVSNPFDSVKLEAKAAIVFDPQTNRLLFAKNATTSLPLASVTKVMTATVAMSLVPETTIITIDADAIKQEGDSKLKIGEKWLLRDLAKFMLIESSNDAAYAISSQVGAASGGAEDNEKGRAYFLAQMNERGKEIGLTTASFGSESGLDIDETQAGAFASAEDTARLLAYALKNFRGIFSETKWSQLKLQNDDGESRSAKNTNRETDKLPLLLASKTGYTDLAGGNLVIAFDAGFGHPIIVSVLGSTADGRFTDVEKLVWSTLEYLAQAK